MKIASVCTFEGVGGAAIAAMRLNQALRDAGHEVIEIVQVRRSDRAEVRVHPLGRSGLVTALRRTVDALPVRLARGISDPRPWTYSWLDSQLPRTLNAIEPDVVHIHWVGGGMLTPAELPLIDAPVVWTLHDLWPLTGGCHFPGDCERYRVGCGGCPQLLRAGKTDLSSRGWQGKQRAYARKAVCFTAPTPWAASRCGDGNPLLNGCQVEAVPNTLDFELFAPQNRTVARRLFGLPADKLVLAVGAVAVATDPRKGMDLFVAAIKQLPAALRNRMCILVFGTAAAPSDLPADLEVRAIGTVHDERLMPFVYSAADLTVVPSREETFCYTAVESAACGTPVAYFAHSGLLHVMADGVTGLAALPGDSTDLARVISDLFVQCGSLCESARGYVFDRFRADLVVQKFLAVYER